MNIWKKKYTQSRTHNILTQLNADIPITPLTIYRK